MSSQITTGRALNAACLPERSHRKQGIDFAACGAYGDVIPDNGEAIPPAGLRTFMVENKRRMPDAVRRWMEIFSATT